MSETTGCCAVPSQQKQEQHGMNERVRRLREESLSAQPHLYMERAKLETEAYQL